MIVTPGQIHDLFYEVQSCPKAAVDLTVPYGGALSYDWMGGGNTQTVSVVGPGTYYYNMIDADGCFHTDSVTVIPIDSAAAMFAPNAFTPDGDGINDVFRIAGYGEIDVNMQIFNRWGELLHTSDQQGATWDGTYQGQFVKNGVYVYRLTYASYCEPNDRVEVFGHVTVLR